MYCAHGYRTEDCPVCRAHQQLKPAIQLIKPALREIPMPVPREEELLNQPKNFDDRRLFSSAPSALRRITPLERNFAVGIQNLSTSQSIFQNRSDQLHSRQQLSEDMPDLTAEVSLLDVRKKFTQK